MKKAGFTLAEVLITLMILGIIAAMTIPSLIQNTQKKEQIVQVKKGMSMINQAITMHYALEQKDLKNVAEESDGNVVTDVFRKRLAVVSASDNNYFSTQDGLSYYITMSTSSNECASTMDIVDATHNCGQLVVSTLPEAAKAKANFTATTVDSDTADADLSSLGTIKGYYGFWVGPDRIVPTSQTRDVIYAKDATKAGSGS